MTVFAFDVGNGFVKAISEKVTLIAPSSIAKESSLGSSSIANELGSNSDVNVYQSNLDDGESYIWGEGIKGAVKPRHLIPTYTHSNRYDSKRFRLLCEFILAELASDFKESELNEVIVSTGMPSGEINSPANMDLKKFLKGKHLITRNGKDIVLNVVDVRILEQPLGTLLNTYMNDEGKMHKDLKNLTITIIDFGAGTTILDTFKNLKRISEESETFYEGMMDVYKDIMDRITNKHHIKGLDESIIEEGIRNDFVVELSQRNKIPFESEAFSAIEGFVDEIIPKVDRRLASREHIDVFLATGGGAPVVGNDFKKNFGEDSLILVEDSQLANVKGYYKFASAVAKKG